MHSICWYTCKFLPLVAFIPFPKHLLYTYFNCEDKYTVVGVWLWGTKWGHVAVVSRGLRHKWVPRCRHVAWSTELLVALRILMTPGKYNKVKLILFQKASKKYRNFFIFLHRNMKRDLLGFAEWLSSNEWNDLLISVFEIWTKRCGITF